MNELWFYCVMTQNTVEKDCILQHHLGNVSEFYYIEALSLDKLLHSAKPWDGHSVVLPEFLIMEGLVDIAAGSIVS